MLESELLDLKFSVNAHYMLQDSTTAETNSLVDFLKDTMDSDSVYFSFLETNFLANFLKSLNEKNAKPENGYKGVFLYLNRETYGDSVQFFIILDYKLP